MTDDTEPLEPFGAVLRAWREARGLTRRELVEASGLSYPYISQLETGSRLPSHKSLARLARALHVEPTELSAAITFDDDSMAPPRGEQTIGAAAARPSAAGWQSNPGFVRSLAVGSTAGRHPPDPDAVAHQVVDIISALPAGERLDVLVRAQRRILDDLVEERVRRGMSGRRG